MTVSVIFFARALWTWSFAVLPGNPFRLEGFTFCNSGSQTSGIVRAEVPGSSESSPTPTGSGRSRRWGGSRGGGGTTAARLVASDEHTAGTGEGLVRLQCARGVRGRAHRAPSPPAQAGRGPGDGGRVAPRWKRAPLPPRHLARRPARPRLARSFPHRAVHRGGSRSRLPARAAPSRAVQASRAGPAPAPRGIRGEGGESRLVCSALASEVRGRAPRVSRSSRAAPVARQRAVRLVDRFRPARAASGRGAQCGAPPRRHGGRVRGQARANCVPLVSRLAPPRRAASSLRTPPAAGARRAATVPGRRGDGSSRRGEARGARASRSRIAERRALRGGAPAARMAGRGAAARGKRRRRVRARLRRNGAPARTVRAQGGAWRERRDALAGRGAGAGVFGGGPPDRGERLHDRVGALGSPHRAAARRIGPRSSGRARHGRAYAALRPSGASRADPQA